TTSPPTSTTSSTPRARTSTTIAVRTITERATPRRTPTGTRPVSTGTRTFVRPRAASMSRTLPLWLTRVRSDAMAPGLRDGQFVLTIRPRRQQRFRRGAVVAVDSLEVGQRIVKRIIGLPGERVRMGKGGVWIDGQPLVEPYASASAY